jgi:hypothetical protein
MPSLRLRIASSLRSSRPRSRRFENRGIGIFLDLRAGAGKQTRTPRNQLSVARGGENVRWIGAYFGCSFSAAELMQ